MMQCRTVSSTPACTWQQTMCLQVYRHKSCMRTYTKELCIDTYVRRYTCVCCMSENKAGAPSKEVPAMFLSLLLCRLQFKVPAQTSAIITNGAHMQPCTHLHAAASSAALAAAPGDRRGWVRPRRMRIHAWHWRMTAVWAAVCLLARAYSGPSAGLRLQYMWQPAQRMNSQLSLECMPSCHGARSFRPRCSSYTVSCMSAACPVLICCGAQMEWASTLHKQQVRAALHW